MTIKNIMLIVYIIIIIWLILFFLGKFFVPRNQLQKTDAIICLAGTRGNINILHERIEKAVELYKQGWSKIIIMTSMFSKKVGNEFKQFNSDLLKDLVKQGRIDADYFDFTYQNMDLNLGADYMKEYAIKMGVPANDILVENESLNTRENAEFTLKLFLENKWHSAILVTSPFHQRRAYLMFHSYYHSHNIKLINSPAESREWNQLFWFIQKGNLRMIFMELQRLWWYFQKKKSVG